jgi:phage terminase large subunit
VILAPARPRLSLPNKFTPRPYQIPTLAALDGGKLRSINFWPRRAGKDLTFCHYTAKKAFERVGMYVHLLPTAKQAKKVVWDAIDNEGRRVLDWAFPKELRESTNESEMKIRFINGSVWQLAGADYFDALVGSNPVGLVMSEASLTDPMAWNYLRPILAGNGGWAAFITTARGYNWTYRMLQQAKLDPKNWHHSFLTCDDTGHMTVETLAQERAEMPDEMFRQEYYNDFSAANVGAILGKYLEAAEREGRMVPSIERELHARVIVSSDIGYRDKAAFWWWQVRKGGFELIDYDEGSGMDAEEWIERLRTKPRANTIYLPHDARVKTFQSRHSTVSQFLAANIADEVRVNSVSKKADSINAARTVIRHCRFDTTRCAEGIEALRNWAFKYSEENRSFGAEPNHDWSSHGSDAFAEGAKVLQLEVAPKAPPPPPEAPTQPLYPFGTLDDLWSKHGQHTARRTRI